MSRTIRAIIAITFVLVITFCAINISQNMGKSLKIDVTDQKLYTLSDGTRAILSKLNQPIKAKLYYAKTATLKAPDQIRHYNNYYQFVKSLLEEYANIAGDMIDLQIIDPRPFSEDEVEALRYGIQRFPITEQENFFFGLVIQTQFGVERTIPFFSPDRQNFLEYDISYLIDTAITRQKTRIGILSSLPVTGDDVSGYMAQMMQMQGKQPKPAWTFVDQLKQQYEVKKIAVNTDEIKDIDILLVIHPKDLTEKTLFAIDQFVVKGGRTIICVDPHCVVDQPDQQMAMQMRTVPAQNSQLDVLLRTWGLEIPKNTFVGDRSLAIKASLNPNQRPETIIGFMNLTQQCFNRDNVITANLNELKFLFAGALRELDLTDEQQNDNQIKRTALITTTNKGNSWEVKGSYEVMFLSAADLMKKFTEGTEPVAMGYLVTGKLKSSFPNGIKVEVKSDDDKKTTKNITGLTEAVEDCAVVVFSDVDFISDMLAYNSFFFGKVAAGDNSNLIMNAIESLSGSTDLISIRSRGNFRRPFIKVDEIEKQAETETNEKITTINAAITGFEDELNALSAQTKEGEKKVIGSTIISKVREIELKKHKARRQLREVQNKKRKKIEHLGNMLRNFNMLTAPSVILLIAIVLSIRRNVRKRHYISHASDS